MKSPSWYQPTPVQLLTVALLAAAFFILLPQLGAFQGSVQVIRQVDLYAVAAALVLLAATFFLAALTYHCLTRKSLQYHRTVLAAVANMFTNRLLPAGTGSIATFYLYLTHNRHSPTQAGSVIAVNNFLGFAGHVTLLAVVLLVYPNGFEGFTVPVIPLGPVLISLVIVASAIVFLGFRKSWHRRVRTVGRRLANDLIFYTLHPLRLLTAFSSSMALTVTNAAVLWCCLLAVGVIVDPIIALAVFTIGMIVGTVTPTPGGLGGAEAGLLAGLVGYAVPADQALATVILYRLLSYWTTLLIGVGTYIYITHRGYLSRPSARKTA